MQTDCCEMKPKLMGSPFMNERIYSVLIQYNRPVCSLIVNVCAEGYDICEWVHNVGGVSFWRYTEFQLCWDTIERHATRLCVCCMFIFIFSIFGNMENGRDSEFVVVSSI